MSGPTASKRRPRAELRELMLTAGVEVFTGLEPSAGGERVNYANVFRHLEETKGVRVTYGSVHERIWDNQREFQIDVLRLAASQLAEITADDTTAVATAIVEKADLKSVQGRRAATRDLARAIGDTNTAIIRKSPLPRLQRAIAYRFAALSEDSEERAQIVDALEDGFAKTEDRFIQIYTQLMGVLGLRPRRDTFGDDAEGAIKALTRLGRVVTDGSLILTAVAGTEPMQLPTGPKGETESWSVAAFGAWITVQGVLEIDGVDDPLEARL